MSVLSLGRLLRSREGVLAVLVLVFLLLFSKLFAVIISGVPQTQWSKTYGFYSGRSVVQTADGGYAAAGSNATRGDRGFGDYAPLLIKTDSSGELEWGKT